MNAPLRAETRARDRLLSSIWGNPPVFARDRFPWNSRTYHAAEIPMNLMRDDEAVDSRGQALLRTLYEAVR